MIATTKCKLVILVMVVTAILIVSITNSSVGTKNTISFSKPRAETNGTTRPSLKVSFDVTNTASRLVFLQVAAIERRSASAWLADTQAIPAHTYRTLGTVGPHGTARLSFELACEQATTRLRVSVSPSATPVQKTQFALCRLWANLRGQGNYKQLWFSDLVVPTYEVVSPELP